MEALKPKKKQGKGRPKTVYKKVGRKPKLTPSLINELEDLVKEGNSIQNCCALLDISEPAYYSWIAKAYDILERQDQESETEIAINSDDEIYLELVKTVKRANAEYKRSLLNKLERHGNKSYQPIIWLLERKYPNEFGLKPQEQSTEDKFISAVDKVITKLSERELPTDEPESNE